MKKIIWSAVFLALIQTAFAQDPVPGSYDNKQGGTQDQKGYPQSPNPTGTNQNGQQPNSNGNPNPQNTPPNPVNDPAHNGSTGANPNTNGNMTTPTAVQTPVSGQVKNNVWDYNNSGATQIEMGNVPAPVNSSFHQKYPDRQNATWYKSQSGYTVRYEGSNHMQEEVMYDVNGHMSGYGRQVKVTTLPQNTITYLEKNNKGQAYETAYMITPSTGTKFYEVYVNGRWMKFDSNGTYVPIK